jgi:hypothetical protein
MVASTKLLHLLEAFSTPWFLFSASTNHHLVFFLLEIFNNIIQYQFDGKNYAFQQTMALNSPFPQETPIWSTPSSGSGRCSMHWPTCLATTARSAVL